MKQNLGGQANEANKLTKLFMRVVIMGLGIYKEGSGISAAKFFISQGDEVLITDLKNEKDLAHQIAELKKFYRAKKMLLPKFVFGRHNEKDFKNADLVMRNPGVPKDSPYLKIAREHGAKIETDISIFMQNCPARPPRKPACWRCGQANVVGVTGTRGKSTTATLIYEILRDANASNNTRMPRKTRIWLGGNIKVSPLSYVDKVKAGDVVVLELSSWLLENFREKKLAPHIAVVTNIYRDHLNTYKNMAEYIAAKKNIFTHQKKSDFLILNGENAETKKWHGLGKTIKFYKKDALKYQTKLHGEHNLENIAASLAVAKIFKVPDAIVKKCLREFKGLPDRQELIAEIRGVKYINDTTATSPDGVIAALRTFGASAHPVIALVPRSFSEVGRTASAAWRDAAISSQKNIILIAGGKDKGLDYREMAKEIPKYCKAVILFPGTAAEKIKKELTAYSLQLTAKDMKTAVRLAKSLAIRGDIILLSPGAASFGLFKNEFDRGEQFKKAILDC